jgi:hypothetical protein
MEIRIAAWLLAAAVPLCSGAPVASEEPRDIAIEGGVIQAPPGLRVFDAWLWDRLIGRRPASQDQERFEIEVRQGTKVIEDCHSLLEVLALPEDVVGDAIGRREHTGYRGCIAVALLERAQPAARSNFSKRSPLADVVDRLDMLSFRSSLGPGFERGESLKWLQIATTRGNTRGRYEFQPTKLILTIEDWYYELELEAAGDWTGDGLEDLMVRFMDDASDATFFYVGTLILEAPTPDGPLIAHEGARLLRQLLLAEPER